jgi:hypothetical protein
MSPVTCPPKRLSDGLRRSSAVPGPVVARSRNASPDMDMERDLLEGIVVVVGEKASRILLFPARRKLWRANRR